MDPFLINFAKRLVEDLEVAALESVACDCPGCRRAVAERRKILNDFCSAHEIHRETLMEQFREERRHQLKGLERVQWDLVPFSFQVVRPDEVH